MAGTPETVSFPPITVPILGPGAAVLWQPPPEEQFSDPEDLGSFTVEFSLTAFAGLLERMRQRRWSPRAWHRLALRGARLALAPGWERPLVADHCRERWKRVGVIPYPHQLATCRRVVRDMGGRAILADEVGLGKTIEAGMILKEYLLRGMVRRALILTPASLVFQWYMELKEKFGIAATVQRSEYDWDRCDILLASIDTAKRPPHREYVLARRHDMLIVDEAHKLKNERSQNWQFVNGIHRTYCLLLTATPVQNDLRELYNLITLLKPGQLGTYRQFQSRFMVDRRTPKNAAALKGLLAQVLVRNRRGAGTIEFTPRQVHPTVIELSAKERELYDAVTAFVRGEIRRSHDRQRNVLPLITLQREVTSSAAAAAETLEKLLLQAQDPADRAALVRLLDMAETVPTSAKVDALIDLIRRSDEQFLVFTEYRRSQLYVRYRLEQAGITQVGFDGSLSPGQKEWARELFRRHAQVLVSTESGGEGLNFQFCRNVINYDLPWNPMRLEQRIGRVHRLGQTRQVHIHNLVTRGTIEEYILFLLYEKINMFQTVIGELDAVISRLRLDRSLESAITSIVIESEDATDLMRRLEELAEEVQDARRQAREANILDRLFW